MRLPFTSPIRGIGLKVRLRVFQCLFYGHLAGAFRIPSIILLGHWYDSAKLHADQWGYPESKVLRREVSEGQFSILSSEEAYKTFSKLIDGKARRP